jgi:hypothetical protein
MLCFQSLTLAFGVRLSLHPQYDDVGTASTYDVAKPQSQSFKTSDTHYENIRTRLYDVYITNLKKF